LLYFNARSICNKQHELSHVLDSYNCDILCICETWLKDSISVPALSADYQVFRQDRPIINGGGVLLAVKNLIPCRIVKNLVVGGCECLFVDIQSVRTDSIRYCLVYRPPDTNLEDSLELYDVIFEYLQNASFFVLLGDFNLPDILWDDLTARSQISREFLTLCFKLGAEQCIDFPTRGNKYLDLLLCSSKNIVNSVQDEPPFSTSDHNSILCDFNNHLRIPQDRVLKPCYKKADYGLINAFLQTLDWNEVYANCNSTVEYWAAFKDIINTAIYNFVPFVYVNKPKHTPWFNGNLKRLRSIKRRKWVKYTKERNIVTHAEYKASANAFRSEFLNAKCNYEQNLFSNQNTTSKFYGYIKSQTRVNTAIPCIKRQDGSLAMTDHEKACEFSDYFSSVFVHDNNILPEFNYHSSDNLSMFSCSARDVVKTVITLRNTSSPGPDGITVPFIKNILANITSPLCRVYNKSLSEGVLPDDWKCAYIVPIFKKGNQQLSSQYRPVSLTSVICKILERIIRKQLMDYFINNNIFPKEQHGFLPKKSTVTNLLECLNDWTRNYDNGICTDVIYLDYSKCFDKVCHSKLLYKLFKYGVNDKAYEWLENFLLDRIQQVKVNNSLSSAVHLKSGVPQGTVLGPLLFLCYSADLVNVVKYSKLSMYADDTKVFKAIYTIQDCHNLQIDLNSIARWAELWQMELNPDKTKLLSIGKPKIIFDYTLNGKQIEKVTHINDIGVIIQSDLKFTMHCLNVTKKAYFVIRNILNTFKNHDYVFYVKMFTTYVRPILEYASQAWSPNLKCNIDKIENVQRYYSRRILQFGNLSYLERLVYIKLDSLEERRLRSDLILFYKYVNGITCINVDDVCTFVDSPRGHNMHLFVWYCRTEKRKQYWTNRIVPNWNGLSTDLINSSSVYIFKRNLENVHFRGRGSIYS